MFFSFSPGRLGHLTSDIAASTLSVALVDRIARLRIQKAFVGGTRYATTMLHLWLEAPLELFGKQSFAQAVICIMQLLVAGPSLEACRVIVFGVATLLFESQVFLNIVPHH